jgi:hypothetical protein
MLHLGILLPRPRWREVHTGRKENGRADCRKSKCDKPSHVHTKPLPGATRGQTHRGLFGSLAAVP